MLFPREVGRSCLGVPLLLSLCACAYDGDRPSDEKNARFVKYLIDNPESTQKILDSLALHQEAEEIRKNTALLRGFSSELYSIRMSNIIGRADAKLKVVMFSDYNCGFCKKASAFLQNHPSVRDGAIAVVIRELPILGDDSIRSARYALAAARLGKYGEFHVALMQAEKGNTAKIDDEISRSRLDPKRLKSLAESSEVSEEIAGNAKLARELGIQSTPAIVVGSKLQRGWSAQAFDVAVKGELAQPTGE